MSYLRRTRPKSISFSDPQPSPAGPDHLSSSATTTTPHPRRYTSPTIIRNRASSSAGHSTTQTRRRASFATAAASPSRPFPFTPSSPPILRPRNSAVTTTTTTTTAAASIATLGPPPPYTPFPLATKSRSSPHISTHQNISSAAFLVQYTTHTQPQPRMRPAAHHGDASSDSGSEPDHAPDEDEDDEDNVIFTAAKQPGHGTAVFRSRRHSKGITTAPGQLGAGETETEADEPPKHLPTARIVPVSGPLVPPNTLEQVITPLLFEASRLLSIVPAIFGVLYNLFNAWYSPINGKIVPIDYVVSALWAALTGYQCLCLTTGLFQRWKVYYPPLSTLIRLLALQAICWPATHFSLTLIGHEKRPVICWAAIGSFTCCSRAVQLWVTSNLWWETSGGSESWRLKFGGRWGGRRWDWTEVMTKCGFPMGVCYFAMAWAEALRREFSGC